MQLGINGRLAQSNQISAKEREGVGTGAMATADWIAALAEAGRREGAGRDEAEEQGAGTAAGKPGERSEAVKIYEAVRSGKGNPLENLRQAPKVPYGHLAKDGIIEYNGVCFVCDEETNSICLGDVSDSKKVITVALSGGGHLKVNRDNLGDLSRAVGMFSPEDLNLIMRAIAKDTKVQSMQREMEDVEGRVSRELGAQDTAEEGTGN